MNLIPATIIDIQSVDTINLVSFNVEGQKMCMMALELDGNLHVGSKVVLGVKATHVALARESNDAISISNQLNVCIESIELGELLSSVKFFFAGSIIESIITKESALRMRLQVGDSVVALVKSSELFIMEVE